MNLQNTLLTAMRILFAFKIQALITLLSKVPSYFSPCRCISSPQTLKQLRN